jgi:sulfoxide reductase heme-binding subunit YedZ
MRAPDPRLLRLAVHAAGLLPFALLVADARLGRLSADPLQEITFRTGKFALIFLVASLSVTPLGTVFGWRWLAPHRRTLGLYAFFYATLHFLTFSWLDYNLDLGLLAAEISEKPYVFVGLAAFSILLALALTSTKGSQKRLGRRWKQLHAWVYVAALLVVVHYTWLVKADRRQPLLWGALIVLLLALRRPAVRRWIAARRQGRRPPAGTGVEGGQGSGTTSATVTATKTATTTKTATDV